jgi:hypothetical protein
MFKNLLKILRLPISIEELRNCEEWINFTDYSSSDPFSITHRNMLSIPSNKEGFEGFLSFQWAYDDEGTFRLPTKDEQKLISAVSNTLDERFKKDPDSFLLLHLASNGLSQWLVMTKNPSAVWIQAGEAISVSKKVNALHDQFSPVFRTEKMHDPEWKIVKDMQRTLRSFSYKKISSL